MHDEMDKLDAVRNVSKDIGNDNNGKVFKVSWGSKLKNFFKGFVSVICVLCAKADDKIVETERKGGPFHWKNMQNYENITFTHHIHTPL